MITPSFGLTATERVLPKLALDFTTASLDARMTILQLLKSRTVLFAILTLFAAYEGQDGL